MPTTPIRGALALGTLLALTACNGKGGDADSGAVCDTCDCIQHPELKNIYPADGATGVYNRTRIYAEVDDDTDFPTSFALTDAGGADVPGTVAFDADDGLVQFMPDVPLSPDTAYTLTRLTNDCEGDSTTFTTGPIGAPVADLNSLVGRTWRMKLGEGLPPEDRDGLQAVLDMVEEDLLINATALNGTTLSATVASTLSGEGQPQNLCVPTTPIELDLTDNPFATGTVPPGYAPLTGQAVPTFGGDVSGSFSADGTLLAGIDLTMVLDMDAASTIMNDDLCALLPQLGVQCESCPAGSGNCLTFNAWGVDGAEDTGAAVVERTEGDIAADGNCP